MKFANVSKGLLLGLALLLATSVFAANIHVNKGSLQLDNSVSLNGKTLPAGEYSVKWEGTGSNVQLNILQGSKVVATTSAHLVDLDQSSNSNAALLKNNGDGSKSLSEIRFNGKKYALAIDEGSPTAEMTGSSR
jgi:hypothetical protein